MTLTEAQRDALRRLDDRHMLRALCEGGRPHHFRLYGPDGYGDTHLWHPSVIYALADMGLLQRGESPRFGLVYTITAAGRARVAAGREEE
jgi:hypothetical protein